MRKHLLSAADLTATDITQVLDTAAHLAKVTDRAIKKVPTLRGRTVCNLFFEDSTRTRISFELAAKRLSADVINFSAKGSSVSKGESLKGHRHHPGGDGGGRDRDPPRRLGGALAAGRVGRGGGGQRRRRHPRAPHPGPARPVHHAPAVPQLRRAQGGHRRRRAAPRVARSNVLALTTMGAEVTLVAPPTLLPARVETWGAAVSYDLDAVLPKQDVVMMLRVQLERQRAGFFPSLREYARLYGLDGRRLDAMADHAIVMHPGR